MSWRAGQAGAGPRPGGCVCGTGTNVRLLQAQRHVNDLYEDLRDGHNLISLLEVLSGDTLVRGAVPFCLPPWLPPAPPRPQPAGVAPHVGL